MVIQNLTNRFGPSKFIVNQISGLGTHTTIGSALTSASSGDDIVVYPGTYTENITVKAGVNIMGWSGDGVNVGFTYGPNLVGKITASFTSGECNISNLVLTTNSDNILAMSGTSSFIHLNNCLINVTNGTGINLSAGVIYINNCYGFAAIGQQFFAVSAGSLQFQYAIIFSTSGSVTQCPITGGTVSFAWCQFSQPIIVSAGTLTGNWSQFTNSGTTVLTTSTTGAITLVKSQVRSGTQVGISVGSGTTVTLEDVFFDSSNATPVSNSGTVVGLATNGQLPIGKTGNNPTFATITPGNGIGVTNGSGAITIAGVGPYPGQTTNTAPPAGYIGELIFAPTSGVTVSLTNNTAANATSISLTAGIWDISAQVYFSGTLATNINYQGAISLTSASTSGIGENGNIGTMGVAPGSGFVAFFLGPTRGSFSGTTTVYLNVVASATTFVGVAGGGTIRAVRVA